MKLSNIATRGIGLMFLLGMTVAHAQEFSLYTVTDLGTLPGMPSSEGGGINGIGQAVGTSFTDSCSGTYCGEAFLYSNGTMQGLGTLGGTSSSAAAINASGQVTGSSALSDGSEHAFLYSNGTMQDLGT